MEPMTSAPTLLDTATDVVLNVPLHRALGLRLRDAADPTAGVELDVTDAVGTPGGVLHGGLHGLLMDVTALLALAAELPPGSHAVTISSSLSIVAGAPVGSTVTASAHVERVARDLAFLTARIESDGTVIATGQFTKSLRRPL